MIYNTVQSDTLFEKACNFMPGGVNSPVRAFKSVGRNPVFIETAKGAILEDIDGNKYIDYVGSFGPLILGHAYPDVVNSIIKAAQNGSTYGASCPAEVDVAQLITEAIPSMEQVRMVNSGTEATMSAIRLARAVTGREKIIKFEGCYHGHGDSFLVAAGSGMLTDQIPASSGIPKALLSSTLVARYNDEESVKKLFNLYKNEIAAIIVEPAAANMGVVPPKSNFMPFLREITQKYGALLIFDEVITGFRTCYGGFQKLLNIEPDLTTLGKIIGGGLPVGAYGGKKKYMQHIAPLGNVYQAGTLSGNPVAMAAGKTMLTKLKTTPEFYQRLNEKTQAFTDSIRQAAAETGINIVINQLASLFTIFFTNKSTVENYDDVMSASTDRFKTFHNFLLRNNIYFPPSQYEACFISAAHTDENLSETLAIIKKAFIKLR